MEDIINSLPDNPEGEMDTLIIYRPVIELTDRFDHNVCTKSQVRAARRKGWQVGFFYSGSVVFHIQWIDYEGSADPDPDLSGLSVDSEHFPDHKFLICLLEQNYGEDGWLTEDEINGITSMSVKGRGISNMKGIEYFTALTTLDCSRNQIKEEAMDSLINSLPTLEEFGSIFVYDNTRFDEGNAFCTKSQAAAAKAKGWVPYYYDSPAKEWLEIESNNESDGIRLSILGTKNGNAPVYNLSGQRVSTPVKGGIYIVGGKKVIVK